MVLLEFAMAPRGQGRGLPTTRVPIPAEVVEQLATLYLERRLTRAEVAEHFGVSENRVRLWLRHLGIRTRTRGAANREDRARQPEADGLPLVDLGR